MVLILALFAGGAIANSAVAEETIYAGPNNLFAHAHVDGTCRVLYAKHDHEVYVTQGEFGPRVSVPRIVLHSNIGGDKKDQACTNTEVCARSEEEYRLGCRHSCVYGTIDWPNGGQGNTNEVCHF